jgi:hypothetical protein
MPFNEALFWFGLTAFGTGLVVLLDATVKRLYSISLTVIGVLACAYSVYHHDHPESPAIRAWLILLGLTWALLGYDLYIRRSRRLPAKPPELITNRSVYDVVGDCSMGEDPLGPWKYGYSQGVGKDFIPFRGRYSDYKDGVDRWFCPEMTYALGVMHNRTDSTVAGDTLSYRIRADMLYMHPGRGGYCAVIRWQCPEDGIYTIQGSCEGLDNQKEAEAEVSIMRNSVELWKTKLVGGDPSAKAFSRPKVYFESGETLDFVVSEGEWFGGDSVGLKATIRKV